MKRSGDVQLGSVPVDNRRSLLSSEMLRFEAFLLFGISRLLHRPFLLSNLFVDAIALAVRGAESEAHCKSAQLQKTPKSVTPVANYLFYLLARLSFG